MYKRYMSTTYKYANNYFAEEYLVKYSLNGMKREMRIKACFAKDAEEMALASLPKKTQINKVIRVK